VCGARSCRSVEIGGYTVVGVTPPNVDVLADKRLDLVICLKAEFVAGRPAIADAR
jgi:hypothetical protein